jgi:hypothetical protein
MLIGKIKSGRLGREGKSGERCAPGEGLQEEKTMQSLVIENFMRVIWTHVFAGKVMIKVAIILKKSNGN